MRLTFCCACGTDDRSDLEHHHLVPRSEGGSDDEVNLITLCSACHGKVHGIIRKPLGKLVRAGLARAKARGVKLGPPKIAPDIVQGIKDRRDRGERGRHTARATKISTFTVQRVRTGKH